MFSYLSPRHLPWACFFYVFLNLGLQFSIQTYVIYGEYNN